MITTSPWTYPMRERRPWELESDIVARRLNRGPAPLGRLLSEPRTLPAGIPLPIGDNGTLRLDAPFERHICGPLGGWRATGRLTGHGPRLVRWARVELLIAPWSDDACELLVVPRSVHLRQWGPRRLRRYYGLAHAAADHLLVDLGSGADHHHLEPPATLFRAAMVCAPGARRTPADAEW